MRVGSYDYYILHIITFNSQSSTLSTLIFFLSSNIFFRLRKLKLFIFLCRVPSQSFHPYFHIAKLRHSHDPLIRSRTQRAPRGHLLHLFLLSRLIRMLHDKPHFARRMPQISFQVRSGYIPSFSKACGNAARHLHQLFGSHTAEIIACVYCHFISFNVPLCWVYKPLI